MVVHEYLCLLMVSMHSLGLYVANSHDDLMQAPNVSPRRGRGRLSILPGNGHQDAGSSQLTVWLRPVLSCSGKSLLSLAYNGQPLAGGPIR